MTIKELVRNSLRATGKGAGSSCFNAALFALLLLTCANAYALGLRVPNQDAEAIARGNAFAATADNPSALYYNPAGITQLEGQNFQYGVHAISINSYYTSPSGSSSHTDFQIQPVPEIYYTRSLKDYPLSFGVGVFAPYGLGLEWPQNTGFRDVSLEGKLMYLTLNPVIAWKVCDQLSIAAGPTVNYAKVVLRQGVTPTVGEFKFKGDDTDFGFTCGLRWQPLEKWSFGAKYHSATTMDFGGTASVSGAGPLSGASHTTASVPFAQFAAAGVSFRPNEKWNIEADVDWSDWHSLTTVTFNNTPLGNIPYPFNWKSSFLYELGVTRYLEKGYFVSAGYFFSQNSTSERDFTPTVPDTNLHVGSVGFGHKGVRWAWTFAGQIITGPDRVITQDTAFPSANGRYHWMNGSLDFSIRYHF